MYRQRYTCDLCQEEVEKIYYALLTDKSGSKFVMICGPCKESILKYPNKYFTIKIYNDEIRKDFE